MADRSKIEWLTRDPSVVKIGWHCEHVSEACRNCYAEAMNRRLGTGLDFKPGSRDDIYIFLDEKMLLQPVHWKRSRMIFVCSMSDLFADFVPDEFIDKIFAIMALCPQHTFQVLTKRPKRMRKYVTGCEQAHFMDLVCSIIEQEKIHDRGLGIEWPLPNVWLGTSCEDQATADERIPDLLATPAAVRFLSAEPLLSPINLRCLSFDRGESFDALGPQAFAPGGIPYHRTILPRLDWVIVGGESGPHARPMHPDWARLLRDQCADAGVPFFFKQWGEFAPREIAVKLLGADYDSENKVVSARIGKRRAGRLLDGVEHNAFPEARP